MCIAAAVNFSDAENPVDPSRLSLEAFTKSLHINTTSVYAAAQSAVAGFAKLDADASKTFIYTGNGLNDAPAPMPALLDLGVGKSATAHLIKALASGYQKKGYK
jgi:hypothetical protein